MEQVSYENPSPPAPSDVRLGKAPARSHMKLLMAGAFMDEQKEPPAETNFWPKRKKFPIRHFGNIYYGSCTRSKQAIAAMRMERLETRRNALITDEEAIRVYKEMTTRRYGADWENDPVGSDTGAYELDALTDWRKPEYTFKDTKGRPLTIDAFSALNHRNINSLKNGLAIAGAKGIAVCFNLPFAFSRNLQYWEIPPGQRPTGAYLPGTWGGHSMWAFDYNQKGLFLDHTWDIGPGFITWDAVSLYCDEAYLVIDSINQWKKKKADIDLGALKKAVNSVSSYQIK